MYPKSPFSQNILFLKISGHWCFLIWNDSFRLRADLTASSGIEIKLHLFLSTTSTCGLHFPHPIILINLKYISVSFFFLISLSPEDFCPFFGLQTFSGMSQRSSDFLFRSFFSSWRSLLVLNFSLSVSHHSLTLKKSFVHPLIFIFFSLSTLFENTSSVLVLFTPCEWRVEGLGITQGVRIRDITTKDSLFHKVLFHLTAPRKIQTLTEYSNFH